MKAALLNTTQELKCMFSKYTNKKIIEIRHISTGRYFFCQDNIVYKRKSFCDEKFSLFFEYFVPTLDKSNMDKKELDYVKTQLKKFQFSDERIDPDYRSFFNCHKIEDMDSFLHQYKDHFKIATKNEFTFLNKKI